MQLAEAKKKLANIRTLRAGLTILEKQQEGKHADFLGDPKTVVSGALERCCGENGVLDLEVDGLKLKGGEVVLRRNFEDSTKDLKPKVMSIPKLRVELAAIENTCKIILAEEKELREKVWQNMVNYLRK